MKIEAIYHNKRDRKKETKSDLPMRRYAKDPVYHPMLLEREYVRALNATKIEKIMAKPFVTALMQNTEGIHLLVKDSESATFATASYDNTAVVWDMKSKTKIHEKKYPESIAGIAIDQFKNMYISQHKHVVGPNFNYRVDSIVNALDYASLSPGSGDVAIATTKSISIFDVSRESPKIHYSLEDVKDVAFNDSFRYVMGSVSPTNALLHDNRCNKQIATVESPIFNVMKFNPQRGHIFSVGGEDGSSYSYDMRNLEKPYNVHRGHVGAVVSLGFHPNGREIATGSFDKTIRFFGLEDRKSRDCYYNDRMQIVHEVVYSEDGRYVISGSDDGNLRLWKSEASKKLGALSRAEKEANSYKNALKEKFRHVGEIDRISRHRFTPHELKQKMKDQHEKYEASVRRKEKFERRREEAEELENARRL